MNKTPTTLVLDRVGKRHGGALALDNVSLIAEAGELVALVGPNGAGKTTLVQMLTALYPPDSGRILVMGHDVAADPVPALRHIGVVFQEQTLDLDLTLRGNLTFHAGLHGLSARDAARRTGELLDRFGLADRATDRVRALSGGNRRRLELVRALLHRPALLVMDEPTAGLDPDSRAALLDDMETLARSGVLVLWTTHLLDEVARADRVLRLDRGRLIPDAETRRG